MGIWQLFSVSWDEKELRKWPSFKKTAYLLLPLLVYFVVHDIAEFLLWRIMELVFSGGGERVVSFCRDNAYTLRGIVNGLSVLAGAAAIGKPVRNEISVNGVDKGEALADAGMGEGRNAVNADRVSAWCFLAAFSFCVSVGLNLLFSLTGFSEKPGGYDVVREMQYGVQFAVGLILYGVVSPIAEEAAFRGLLYNRMKRCFNYPVALVVSSLLFGFYHGNLVQAVYGTVLGIMIAYMYEKYKSFAAPVLFHAVANVSIFTLTYGGRLSGLKRGTGFFVMAALLAAAGVCLWRISQKK